MIISHINGGLGNQMFQYAAGKTLAHLRNTLFKLDVSAFEISKSRSFDLKVFEADISFATKQEISNLLPSHSLEKAFQFFSPVKKKTYYRERSFSFDNKFFMLGKNVYLKGYFQSEKYFSPVKDVIRKKFTFKSNVFSHLSELASRLNNPNSVSIHIRRGDYLKDSGYANYHGMLEKDYYKTAIEFIRSKIPGPTFYLFSDDISWVNENFTLPDSVQISDTETKNHFEDLYLMSRCKHNIIANSSFSWWGAWLNNNPDKLVIAPENWFNSGPKDTQDLIPDSWLKI